MKIGDVYEALNAWAPVSTAMQGDNVGLLAGCAADEAEGAVAALDCTMDVIREAVRCGANLIVTHHPVIFHPLRRLVAGSFDADRVSALLRGGISVISLHTNLDSAEGGVNDCLAGRLGLSGVEPLPGGDGIARMGALAERMETDAFLRLVRTRLGAEGLRASRTRREIRRVAVGGGACAEYLDAAAAAGCDALVTADCKHHQYLEAAHLGLLLTDATHYATENVVVPELARRLRGLGLTVREARTENPVRGI